MAESKTTAKAKTRKTAAKKTAAKKTAPRKTAAKATATKTRAKRASTSRKAAPKDLRSMAVATSRNALRAGLGVYGMAYDQMVEQLEALQAQVDEAQGKLNERRKQAEAIYESLVKRGTVVEQEAIKAFEDLELDALTDRTLLDERMTKAKARFDELRAKVSRAA